MHKASVKLIVCPKGPEISGGGDGGDSGGGGADNRGGDGGGGQLEWEVPVKQWGQGVSLEHAWPILHHFKAQVGDILVFRPGRDSGSFIIEVIKKPVEELSVKASYALPPPPLLAAAVTEAVEEAVVAEEATAGAAEEAPVIATAAAEEMEMEMEMGMEMATAAAISAAAGDVGTVAEATGVSQRDMEGQAAALRTTSPVCHWGLIAPPMEPMSVFASEGYCTAMLPYPPPLPPQQQQLLKQQPLPPHQQQEQQWSQEQEGQGAGVVRSALLSGRKRQRRAAAPRPRRQHEEQHEAGVTSNRPYPGVVVEAASVIGWLFGGDPRLGDSAATATNAASASAGTRLGAASRRQRATITEPQAHPAGISEEATAADEANGRKQSSRSDRESEPWVNEGNEAANGGCCEAALQQASQQVLSAGQDGQRTEARAQGPAEARDVDQEPQTNRPPSLPQHLPPAPAPSQQQSQWHQPLTSELGMGTAVLKMPRAVLPMPDYPRVQRRRAATVTPHAPPQPPQPLRPAADQNQNPSAGVDMNEDIDIYCLVGATDPAPTLRPMGSSRGPRFSRASESIDFLHILADVAICLAEGGGSPDTSRPGSLQPMTQDPWVSGSHVTGYRRTGFAMDKALAGKGHRRKRGLGVGQSRG
ncbi:hypothetical protein Vafri_9628 [Volvox africanus]|nr:hypothetical protein Vafri_9628 [Volvox africanus]